MVVDHHTGRLVWAALGRDRKTVEKFTDLLGEERCGRIRLVSCDDAEWITRPIAERCPDAVICLDPWHIVKAATDALDEIRREIWNEARRAGNKHSRKISREPPVPLWKKPENLSERQKLKLAIIQKLNAPLDRAYLLKEQLRPIYHLPYKQAIELLNAWLKWARRCRLEPFVKLARRITEERSSARTSLERSHRPHAHARNTYRAAPCATCTPSDTYRTGRGPLLLAMPVLRRGTAHRCPRAYATVSVAMPKFIPRLNLLTPRPLFSAVAAWEVTVSLMLLATTVPCPPLARLSEARFRSKIGIDRPPTVAVSCFVLVLMTKLVSVTLLPLWLKVSPPV